MWLRHEMNWNITFDPAEPAEAVDDPKIAEVRSSRSGQLFDTVKLISSRRYDRLVRIRNALLDHMHRGSARLVCAICGTPVYLVATAKKRFFFRHIVEDGSCPARTREKWSKDQIRAMKYLGARESEAHRTMKERVARGLRADPRCSNVSVESVWRSSSHVDTWRKPDVQACFEGQRIAFEAQLTTTFLDVVTRRRQFYREEGALLIWVLRSFDPEHRRLTEDDICFPNNSNVFVVDEETTCISEFDKRFVLRCFYREPRTEGNAIVEAWRSSVVALDQLRFDFEKQQAWWFDHDSHFAAARVEIQRIRRDAEQGRQTAEKRRVQAIEEQKAQLRADVLGFWERNGSLDVFGDAELAEWARLFVRLTGLAIHVPDRPAPGEFRTCILAILSAKLGRPVGFGFKRLVEVAHHLAEHHRNLLFAFGWALRAYGTKTVVYADDKSGAWARKSKQIRSALAAAHPEYVIELGWRDAMAFLFPEISQKLHPRTSGPVAHGRREDDHDIGAGPSTAEAVG
jgi:hypothetical protein